MNGFLRVVLASMLAVSLVLSGCGRPGVEPGPDAGRDDAGQDGGSDGGTGDGGSDAGTGDGGTDAGVAAPETTLTEGPRGTIATRTARFIFTADVAGSTFECSLDGAGFSACASPKDHENLPDGAHTFSVRATANGLTDATPATRSWSVDGTAPDTAIGSAPSGTVASSSARVTFTATEPGSTFACSLDGAAFAACASPYDASGLSDGAHTFQVRATDALGNADATPATAAWTVDTASPETTLTSSPGAYSGATARFTFSSNEQASFECSLDLGPFTACASPASYSGLGDGSHVFQARAVDAAGNVDATPTFLRWTVDTLPPDTELSSGPSGLVTSRTAVFTFGATQAGSTFECSLDGSAFTLCASPVTFDGLSDGPHTLEVRAVDPALNVDPTPAAGSWAVDGTPPQTVLDSGPSGTVTSRTATFAFSANEAGVTFECNLDGSGFLACASPASYANLQDGAHSFAVRATDAAGNIDGTPAERGWNLDATAPDTTLASGPSGTTRATTARFTFTASEASATFECSLDGAAFATCASPRDYSDIAEGAHTFRVRALDALGNADATPASRGWTVDLSAPDTRIDSGPSSLTSDSTATFTFSSTEAGGTFECSLDGAAFAACVSGVRYTGLSEGPHSVLVRAVDAAGNADGTPASHAWRIDQTPPRTTITSGPSGATNATSATFGFTSDDPGATYECGIDSELFSPCTSPVSYTGLTERSHTFAVRGIDAARNREGTPATRSWTVDLTPPDTTIRAGPQSRTNATTATFDFTSDAGATFECSLDDGPFTACASRQSFHGLAEGAHSLQARATDPAGNVDATPATWSWTVDLTPPDTTLTSGPAGVVSTTSATFEFSGSEPGGFECSLDDSVFASCVSPKSYSGVPQGSHTFTVRAVDTAGNVDPSPASRTWTVDTAPPDTTPPDTTLTSGPPSVTNATTASFTFTATEPGSFECSLDGGAFATCASPKEYSGLGHGSHTFRVRALDTVGNADPTPASRTWTVDITPPETTITAGPAGTITETTATFSFTSNESGTFECALDSVTFTACTSPKSYTGLTVGTHTFSVRAIDAVNNTDPSAATRTWTITVSSFVKLRVMAANTTSGNLQSYDPGHGIRIFQGLKPDIVLIQEFNYGDNSAATIRAFVDSTFGPGFYYYRQSGMQIPNGIISRYPIIASGFWDDTAVSNRDFAWARIDIPGSKDLWAVSLHLLTTDSSRPGEATQLVNYINANVPAGDYLVVGGDLNTDSRTETCMNTLSQVVVTSGPYPVDQNGTDGTNASRSKPYDWVLADTDLNPLHVPAVIGSSTYSSGLVFDSRVYTPLSEVAPVLVGDSGATNMQHQAVVKDFSVSTQ